MATVKNSLLFQDCELRYLLNKISFTTKILFSSTSNSVTYLIFFCCEK